MDIDIITSTNYINRIYFAVFILIIVSSLAI